MCAPLTSPPPLHPLTSPPPHLSTPTPLHPSTSPPPHLSTSTPSPLDPSTSPPPHLSTSPTLHLSDTSRSPHSYELNGQHFFFVSRQKMERDIQNNQFIEHGYLDGDYYGTSINSIRDETNSGKTCLLVLIPAVSVIFNAHRVIQAKYTD